MKYMWNPITVILATSTGRRKSSAHVDILLIAREDPTMINFLIESRVLTTKTKLKTAQKYRSIHMEIVQLPEDNRNSLNSWLLNSICPKKHYDFQTKAAKYQTMVKELVWSDSSWSKIECYPTLRCGWCKKKNCLKYFARHLVFGWLLIREQCLLVGLVTFVKGVTSSILI